MSGYDSFAADYDLWAGHMTDGVARYAELAREAAGPMVERARDLPLELRLGDIRDFVLEHPVDLVVCPFRSLLHLPTWADRRRVFERVAAALRPGGRFAWNAFASPGSRSRRCTAASRASRSARGRRSSYG